MDIQTALIVDDSKMARFTLKKQLENRNISVNLANSGEESIVFLINNHPDVIFMDCLMPGINGFEVTQKILSNSDTSDIPVIMCSAKESDEDKQKAFNSGASGFMTKSSSSEPLNAILDELRTVETKAKKPKSVKEAAPVNSDDIKKIAEQTANRIAEKISQEVATTLAKKVAEKVAEKVAKKKVQDQISVLTAQYSAELNKKISTLSEQLENKIIYSFKSSLHDVHQSLDQVHRYIDKKIANIDQVNIPELKESISKPIEHSIKSNNQLLQHEVEQLKTELAHMDINNIVEQKVEQQLQKQLPSYLSSLLEKGTGKKLIESMIQAQLNAQNIKLEELEEKLTLKIESRSHSNILGFFALMIGAGGLLLSAYLFFNKLT